MIGATEGGPSDMMRLRCLDGGTAFVIDPNSASPPPRPH
jgi:hypothetical protein